MPSLARSFGGPVEALIGYVAAATTQVTRSTIVGPRSDPDDLTWLRSAMPGAEVVPAGPTQASFWRSAPAVIREIARRLPDADVVHVHGLLNPVSSGAAQCAIRRGAAVVIGPFGTLSRYTFAHRRRLAKRWYFGLIDAPNLRRAAAVHFTTAAERDEAAWHGIDFTGRAYVVPPPYRADRPRPHNRMRGTAAGAAASDCGSETVLFLGRLVPTKGVEVLLDAWASVRAMRPDARLVIAGSGESDYEAALHARLKGSSARTSGVTFTGFVSGGIKERCLADAAVFVLPSHHENFGIAVLEAVGAGVPVVVSPAVQLAPWIEANGLGIVADRTPEAVASAIVRVLDSADLRARVATVGFDSVMNTFAPSVIAPLLAAMYAGAVAATDAKRAAS